MGCCFSTGNRAQAEQRQPGGEAEPRSPPAPFDEETVKEVLLETPVIPKSVRAEDEGINEMPKWKAPEAGSTAVIDTNPSPFIEPAGEIVSEVYEASEMWSYGESLSSTTAQEKPSDEENDEVIQRPAPREKRGLAGGRGRVPARRSLASSAEKRGQVAPVRSVGGRPVVGQPRSVLEENGRRRDPGDGSSRISRTPVVGGEMSGKSPEPPQAAAPAEEAESLENPVVSLECFIFL